MKNRLFQRMAAITAACTVAFAGIPASTAFAAGEINIGVTSFADTLEPTEQYPDMPSVSAWQNLMKTENWFPVWQKAGKTARTERPGPLRFVKA